MRDTPPFTRACWRILADSLAACRQALLTSRGRALSDVKLIELFSGVATLLQINVFDVTPLQIVLAVGEGLKLFEHDVVNVQLHVVERVEQRVDEPRGEFEELRKLLLQQVVIVLVFARRNFELLFDLTVRQWCSVGLTLKRFFSSLKLFSFFPRSLFRLLLWRS